MRAPRDAVRSQREADEGSTRLGREPWANFDRIGARGRPANPPARPPHQTDNLNGRRTRMPDQFEYISRSRLLYRNGARHAYLGEVPEPVVYGVQGALREYYGVKEGPPVASTLDHIVAAVAG